MKSSTRDNAEGKMHQVKGKIKEAVGKQSGIATWKPKAKSKIAREIQEKLGQVKKVMGK